MSAASKGLAEFIMKKCGENPKVAFLLVPLGLFLVYSGVKDARFYQSLGDRPTKTMTVTAIESIRNDRGFAVPHLTGTTDDGQVSISVSPKRARQTAVGEEIGFVETGDESRPYELRSTLDDQLSQIFFSIAGFPFNFIALLGAVITLGACGWGTFAKPKAADKSSTPDADE